MDHRSDSKKLVALRRTTSLIQQEQGSRQGFPQVTIGSLPDYALLMIFHLFIEEHFAWNRWIKLVHVCQRWRYITFESPIRLNLQLYCTGRSPVRKSLDIWLPLPLVVVIGSWDGLIKSRIDNIVAALEQRDHVHRIAFTSLDQLWEQPITAMQKPFPMLRSLSLESSHYSDLPDTLLNGSAPSLQDLVLQGISFPSLPRLLSSTSDLTSLHLFEIPDSGYIPPEEMATSLSALPKLKSLIIDFKSSLEHYLKSEEINRRSPPPTRFVLPALTELGFKGISEYLEFLAARIDAPRFDEFQLTLLHWDTLGFEAEFLSDISQTIRFIGLLDSFRPDGITLEFKTYRMASISFLSDQTCPDMIPSSWSINCRRLDWQVESVARICSQILPFCSRIKSLNIKCWPLPGPDTQRDGTKIDSMLWTQIFDSFPSVQRLEIPAILESSITPALQGHVGESATKVLPSLQSLSVVGKEPARQGIAA